jgi:L-lactate dehydrogenase complex protein LldF
MTAESLSGASSHPVRAAAFVARDAGQRARWHDQALWFVRARRDRAARALPEWEELRTEAQRIKAHTMARLPEYLAEFEDNARRTGAIVHWARDAAEHNQIVLEILRRHAVTRVVKSKSMLTEECHLNPFLERHGIEVVDTDLGERIVQLRGEPPSHIVLPAIHLKKEDVGETFHQHLGTPQGTSDPKRLTEAARGHLREKFLQGQAGITGVNFAVAETGGIVICTNEGNADLGVLVPGLHIACMGIEKLVPRAVDLGVFVRLLARSATGQPVTTYTAHFHGPRRDVARAGEFHIVLVDNGRSRLHGSTEFSRSLACIRCGACMNTCPVYRRSGGHSYEATIPGPIGSILGPARDPEAHASLPFACSLCGSCTDVCPVKIDLHHQIFTWRRELALQKLVPWSKRLAMWLVSFVLARVWLYRVAGGVGRAVLRKLPRRVLYARGNTWGRQRDLPPAPDRSFRALYRMRRAAASPDGGARPPGTLPQ